MIPYRASYRLSQSKSTAQSTLATTTGASMDSSLEPLLDDLIEEINSSFEPVFRNVQKTKDHSPPILPISSTSEKSTDVERPHSQSSRGAGGVLPAGAASPVRWFRGPDHKGLGNGVPTTPSTCVSDLSDGDIYSFPGTPTATSLPCTPSEGARISPPTHRAAWQCAPRMEPVLGTSAVSGSSEIAKKFTTVPDSLFGLQDRVESNSDFGTPSDNTSEYQATHSEQGRTCGTHSDQGNSDQKLSDTKSDTSARNNACLVDLIQGIWESKMKSQVLICGKQARWKSGHTASFFEVNSTTLEMCFNDQNRRESSAVKGETWQATLKQGKDGGLKLVWTDGDCWKMVHAYCNGGISDTKHIGRMHSDGRSRSRRSTSGIKETFGNLLNPIQKANFSSRPAQPTIALQPPQEVVQRTICMGPNSDVKVSGGTNDWAFSISPADRDTVSVLATSSVKKASKENAFPVCPEANIQELRGVWTYSGAKGLARVKIEGDTATWPEGERAKITSTKNAEFVLQFNATKGTKYYAKLRPEDGALCWSDGAIWTRVTESPLHGS